MADMTEAQKAKFEEWRKKWTKIGLSTAPADKERAERGFRGHYEKAGIKWPGRVVWVDSPLVLSAAAPIAALMYEAKGSSRLADAAKATVEFVGDRLDKYTDATTEAVRETCHGIGGYKAKNRDEVLSAIRDLYYLYMGGQFWISYVMRATFDRDVLKKKVEVGPREDTDTSCGWWWPHEQFVIACNRPRLISLDDRERLHNESGPSMEWRDGWGIYAWHGIVVEPKYITATVTPEWIDTERNMERKRILLERFGYGKYLDATGATKIAQDDFGTVYHREMPDGQEPLVIVRVVNGTKNADGTNRIYDLPVHPQCRPLLGPGRFGEPQPMSGLNAVASTYGLTGKEYIHLKVRT